MSSKEPDLQAYLLGELAESECRQVEQYLALNPEAALEVERLRMVTAALRRLPEEEPPRRIAFVSDKVFEPAWYLRLWNSASRLGFASAAMLAAAIVAHGVMMQRATAPVVTPTQISPAEISRLVDAEVARRMDAVVVQVRAEGDSKSQRMVNAALDAAEKKFVIERQQDRLAVEVSFDRLQKQLNRALRDLSYRASNERPAGANQ